VRAVVGPKRRFALVPVEQRDFFPIGDHVHVRLSLCIRWSLRYVAQYDLSLRLASGRFTASFVPVLPRQRMIEFALVKELFFRIEWPGTKLAVKRPDANRKLRSY